MSVEANAVGGTEITRRMFNIWEALVVSGLVATAGLLFSTREAVIKLQVTQEATNKTLGELQAQLASFSTLSSRVTRNEARIEQLETDVRDIKERAR